MADKIKPLSEENGGCGSFQPEKRYCTKPAWLLSTLSDLDQRIRILMLNSDSAKGRDQADTFAQRAESYYQQRPKLLALLLDLYNNYLSLADRYCQSLHKHNHNHHNSIDSQVSAVSSEPLSGSSVQQNHSEDDYQSDAESSLSYQLPSAPVPNSFQYSHNDEIIAELVIKNVEYDLMVHELGANERQAHESSRKIELQKSLLEVLESERMILLNENAGLRYKVSNLIDENKGLASESMFMKHKAGELARCVLKMREDHRVCMLSRKIEELQGKIHCLEKRNQEYYQQLLKREQGKCPSCREAQVSINDKKGQVTGGVSTEACFQANNGRASDKKKVKSSKWWNKFKSTDLLFLCKPQSSESVGC